MAELQQFAELDGSNNVIRTIAADQDFIDSGAVGDSANWIEFIDSTGNIIRGYRALIGSTYNSGTDAFAEHPDVVDVRAVNAELAEDAP